jgi:hypothetical protein
MQRSVRIISDLDSTTNARERTLMEHVNKQREVTYTHINTMEPSPSREAARYYRHFQNPMEPESSLPCSQEPSTGPHLSQTNPVHITPNNLSKILHDIFAHTSSGLLTSGFVIKSQVTQNNKVYFMLQR